VAGRWSEGNLLPRTDKQLWYGKGFTAVPPAGPGWISCTLMTLGSGQGRPAHGEFRYWE
jgi:hypothetical protein